MKRSIPLCILAFAFYTFIGCTEKTDDSEDVLPPKLSNVSINGKQQIDTAYSSERLILSGTFNDNEELGSLEIKVDGNSNSTNWEESIYVDLFGKTQDINYDLEVSPNAKTGLYTLTLKYTDVAGNKSLHGFDPFLVLNSSRPRITDLEARFDNGAFNSSFGDTLRVFGLVQDVEDLQLVSIHIRLPQGYGGNPIYFEQKFYLSGTNDKVFDLNQNGDVKVYFPFMSKIGTYPIIVTALDSDQNSYSRGTSIEIWR